MGRPTKGTPEIKQVVIELTPLHPNFSDFQITQTISERFANRVAPSAINRNQIECLRGAVKRRHEWSEISTRQEEIQITERVWCEFEWFSIDCFLCSFADRDNPERC
jgi:hypothetical protein